MQHSPSPARRILSALAVVAGSAALLSCSDTTKSSANAPTAETQTLADSARADQARVAMRLARFDSLDFDVYSNQKWDQLHVSHADNIVVHYPDGHTTTGLPDHIEELKPMFVFAPDTKIKVHPIKFGTGQWTSVMGEMEGTFSKPMPMGGGKTIAPTGKRFKLSMVTVGRWEGGKMAEEFLMWDNAAFMKQLGVGQ